MLKAERTAETKKHRFLSTFEERRMKRDKLYKRLIKVYFNKETTNSIYYFKGFTLLDWWWNKKSHWSHHKPKTKARWICSSKFSFILDKKTEYIIHFRSTFFFQQFKGQEDPSTKSSKGPDQESRQVSKVRATSKT